MATRQGPTPEFDFSKLTVQEKIELAQRLTADAAAEAHAKFEENVTWFNGQIKSLGRTKLEAITALVTLMDFEENKAFMAQFTPKPYMPPVPVSKPAGEKKPRAARGTKPEKVFKDKDSTGARPQPGAMYKHKGMEWVKAQNGLGAAKKEFIEAIAEGFTWAEMEVKPAA